MGSTYDHIFHAGQNGQQQIRGLISEPLPDFFTNNTQAFYRRRPDEDWELLGTLSKPGGNSDFPQQYRVTLDEQDKLRIHAGAVPYWTSETPEVLKVMDGRVYSLDLDAGESHDDENLNPFSGKH